MGWTGYSYTGAETLVSDPQGRRRKYSYDALGRLTKVTEEDSQGNLNVKTTYEYDVLERLRRILEGVQTRTFVYDSLGRLTSKTHPESGTTIYGYDDSGNMTTKIDARGVVTTNTYDALNRLISSSHSDGAPTVTYAYDAAGNSVTRGSRSFVWDGAGRLKQVWRASDGALYGSYRYDPLGRRVKKTWNYPGSAGQLVGSELYVYGAGGEILVEYRSESGECCGAQTTTSYNVMLDGRAVAKRVTGNSEVLGPIDRVDLLYRNHLGEVVLNAWTPYG